MLGAENETSGVERGASAVTADDSSAWRILSDLAFDVGSKKAACATPS